MSPPLILTLALHHDDQVRFEQLRRRHFPAERNLIPAHLTLFHHLPGVELASIQADLEAASTHQRRFTVDVTGLCSLGRGVVYTVHAPALLGLRAGFARHWHDHLTPQDRQGWRPHVTIQNKAAPADAVSLLATMPAAFTPFEVRADGLELWRYQGGPWTLASRQQFQP